MKPILSIFPGLDLLGKAFEQNGFCVLRGPDKNTDGGDIKNFHIPKGVVEAVIGGPPCQDFSRLNRDPGNYSYEMLGEYKRVVIEADPEWFLIENVQGFPDVEIDGYVHQRFTLDLAWFVPFTRRRDFIFGSKKGRLLNPIIQTNGKTQGGAVVGNDKRSFRACCDIMGLPKDFDLPFYSAAGKKQAVANGVPMAMGNYIAQLILFGYYGESSTNLFAQPSFRRCDCGCGRVVVGRQKYAHQNCRKSAERQRKRASQ